MFWGFTAPVNRATENWTMLPDNWQELRVAGCERETIRGINQGTAFHCYVVADITRTLENSIIGRFTPTPDGEGYFGYSSTPPAFIEVIPYGKILRDAKTRNYIFFQKLGITEDG